MKKNLTTIALVAMSLLVSACNRQEEQPQNISAKLTITKGHYVTSSGAAMNTVWEAKEPVTLFVESQPAANYTVTSAESGGTLAVMLANISRPAQPDTFIALSPVTTDATYASGLISTALPSTQNGAFVPYLKARTTRDYSYGIKLSLEPVYACMCVTMMSNGRKIQKVVLSGNNSEKLSGATTIDAATGAVTCSSEQIDVIFDTPLDISNTTRTFYIMLPPIEFASGFSLAITDTSGNTTNIKRDEALSLAAGQILNVSTYAMDNTSAKLIYCGDRTVTIIDADKSDQTSLSIIWNWSSTELDGVIPPKYVAALDHIDECKPVDNNTKILLTASYNATLLLDIDTRKPLFWAYTPNAHSAEMLPSDRIAVAMSTAATGNKVAVYNISMPDVELCSVPLESAHGVVWDAARESLFAVGGNLLNEYKLVDWSTTSPSLKLVKQTSTPKGGLHDLVFVNDDILMLSGNGSYLFDIDRNTFTARNEFTALTSLKSVNYNITTGQTWYTVADTGVSGAWWTYHIFSMNPARQINVPGVNVYKCRVMNW